MKNKLFILLIIALAIVQSSYAQITISGKVTDPYGEAIPGVNVMIKGISHIGTITDLEGQYSLEVPDSASVLVFSFVGMKSQEEKITGRTYIETMLENDDVGIDEIVVTAYGIRKEKKCLGYAVSSSTSGIRIRGATSTKSERVNYGSQTISGQLTAGEINDFGKWKLWKDISKNQLKQYRKIWPFVAQERYTVQLKTKNGFPVIDAQVQLVNKSKKTIWQARTDNTGKAELWHNAFKENTKKEKLSIVANYQGQTYKLGSAKKFHQRINNYKIDVVYNVPTEIDIAFVVDATGSMGDEISYLKNELYNIMDRVKDSLKGFELNLASVFYRDKDDAYLTKTSKFSKDINTTVNFIKNNSANGGGDTPEAVDAALNKAINSLAWNEKALSRIIFLILDAPPHNNPKVKNEIREQIRKAATMGIRIIPVTCSGIDKSTEYLMRTMALLTNGTYTFLTDDSGIGNAHIKPTTDEYKVEKLNDLIIRLIYQYTFIPKTVNQIENIEADTTFVSYPDVEEANGDNNVNKNNNQAKTPINGDNKVSWRYFPNPTKGEITIESELDIHNLYVLDLSGKILEKHDADGKKNFLINLSNYPAGIYFISYEENPNKWHRGKVLLTK